MISMTGITMAVSLMVTPCDGGPWSTRYDRQIERSVQRYWPLAYRPLWCDWKAQLIAESGLRPTAESPVGAVGIAQIMPGTWNEVTSRTGIVDCHPRHADCSITIGAIYMRWQLDGWTWHRPIEARLQLAQASYNAGRGHIINAQSKCNHALLWPEIRKCLPSVTGRHAQETIGYVDRISRTVGRLRRR